MNPHQGLSVEILNVRRVEDHILNVRFFVNILAFFSQ